MQSYASKRGWSALIVIALVLVFGPCVPAPEAHAQSGPVVEIVHVNIDREWPSNDPEDGETWITAYRFLQDGLAKADDLLDPVFGTADRVEIWVAAGTYLPDQGTGYTAGNRNHSFHLRNNVAIYGGFSGDGWETQLSDRNWETNVTILDGDLLGDDEEFDPPFAPPSYSDNSHSVVRSIGNNDTAILDGFTIRGGVSIIDSFIAMRNCTVTANAAGVPALHIAGNSEPRIFRCTFHSSHGRPVIIEDSAQPVFIDCTIAGEFCNLRPPHSPPTSPTASAAPAAP